MGMTNGTGPMTSSTEDSLRLHIEGAGLDLQPRRDRRPCLVQRLPPTLFGYRHPRQGIDAPPAHVRAPMMGRPGTLLDRRSLRIEGRSARFRRSAAGGRRSPSRPALQRKTNTMADRLDMTLLPTARNLGRFYRTTCFIAVTPDGGTGDGCPAKYRSVRSPAPPPPRFHSSARPPIAASCKAGVSPAPSLPVRSMHRRVDHGSRTIDVQPLRGGIDVNWDVLEGNWNQFKGAVREKWGDLTDDDLDRMAGNREQFVGRLQERYGMMRDQAEREADAFVRDLNQP